MPLFLKHVLFHFWFIFGTVGVFESVFCVWVCDGQVSVSNCGKSGTDRAQNVIGRVVFWGEVRLFARARNLVQI
jgi:hypothetical protein